MNFDIIIQAFLARMLPIYHEVLLQAVRHLQFEHYPLAALQAGVGGLAACALLYAIGVFLKRLPERISTPEQRERIEKMRVGANGLLPWLLVFAPLPMGGMIVMASGFFGIPAKKVAVILVAVEVLFRAMPYLR